MPQATISEKIGSVSKYRENNLEVIMVSCHRALIRGKK